MRATLEVWDCVIWVCQGPPRCTLEGDDAIKAQEDGCVWCQRIYRYEDGREEIMEPGNG